MPWHIETANPECASGYAVVKDSDGTVEGCHRTRREARAQLAALNIAESERSTIPAIREEESGDSYHRDGTLTETIQRGDE